MSDITQDLYTMLQTAATPASNRVFPLVGESPITAASYPFVTWQRLASPVDNVLAANGSPPINHTRFQVDCYDLTYRGAKALADAVIAAFAAWTVQNVLVSSPEDFFEDQIRAYRVLLEFSVWHYD
jgi:Protein of unknown function (DUF3168)